MFQSRSYAPHLFVLRERRNPKKTLRPRALSIHYNDDDVDNVDDGDYGDGGDNNSYGDALDEIDIDDGGRIDDNTNDIYDKDDNIKAT